MVTSLYYLHCWIVQGFLVSDHRQNIDANSHEICWNWNIAKDTYKFSSSVVYSFHFFFCFACCRKNVPLKKVNSKYILKSTLTPRLARKQFQKNTTGIERSRSWSSLDNANASEKDYTSQNYLTIHVSSCRTIMMRTLISANYATGFHW